jgi:hypothetical protein
MSNNGMLRDRGREAIRTGKGKLPDRAPIRTWGGQGSGTSCAICGERLRPDEVEFELEFAADSNGRGGENCHVHVCCFSAWERQRLELKRTTMAVTGLSGAGGEIKVAATYEGEARPSRGPP